MKHLMKDLISTNQNAFIPEKNITENSLLAHELLWGFNRKTSNMCINIDLHKGHDRISREFIYHMMISLGSTKSSVDYIYLCI